MLQRFSNRFKFEIERYVIRGPWHRLLVIAVAIGLIAASAGLFVFYEIGGFNSAAEAIWWAFLRLTDPGYLGDDEGAGLRTVSTLVTVLGYVVFLGALIAIMTQWLNETMFRLQSGLTPIVQNNHIVILGWTNRTPMIVQELLLSEKRLKWFLRRRGASQRIRIVILVEKMTPALVQDLKERLGRLWESRQIIFRTGSPLRLEHLHRVDFQHAAAILLPAREFNIHEADTPDGQAIKVLLALEQSSHDSEPEKKPRIVSEIFDARKVAIAHRAYTGPMEIVASDQIIGRLIAQTIRHPGLSDIYSEILAHTEGNEIYTRDCPELKDLLWADLPALFPEAVPIGVVHRDERIYHTVLNPARDRAVKPDDRIVFIALDYDSTEPDLKRLHKASTDEIPEEPVVIPVLSEPYRILMLGWSHKAPALITEFESYHNERFEITVFSMVPIEDRDELMAHYGVSPDRVQVRHVKGDYTSANELAAAAPSRFTHIFMLSNDWTDSAAESDARTILGYLVLHDLLASADTDPHVLVELMDPANSSLLASYTHETLITPVILSHMLTHVTLRRELRSVFDALFCSEGPEIWFVPASVYGLCHTGRTFTEIQATTAAHGDIALGIRTPVSGGPSPWQVRLNPARNETMTLAPEDEIIVLTQIDS